MLAGQHWQHAAGGPGTRGVMALAAVICPAAIERVRAVRVADGAHTLDRAVLRRIVVQLHMGSGCSVPDKPPAVRADRRRDHGGGEKMKGIGKSM
jgi:hypothetical protein